MEFRRAITSRGFVIALMERKGRIAIAISRLVGCGVLDWDFDVVMEGGDYRL